MSFSGGWIDGAFQTGLNAATAVMTSLQRQDRAKNVVTKNPVTEEVSSAYDYSTGKDGV